MDERVKKIVEKMKDWWKKFDRKQKGIVLSALSVVFIMVLILVLVFNHKTYTELGTYDDTNTSAQVVELLKTNGIEYKTSIDGKTIEVDEKKLGEANLLLGSNSIEPKAYSFDNVVNGSLTTTEADKRRMKQMYSEDKMEQDLMKIDTIKSASVNFYIPENTGTLISNEQESYAAIYIETTEGFKDDTAEAIAKMAAYLLGNDTTDRISIMDTAGKLIYPKTKPNTDDEDGPMLDITDQLAFTKQVEQIVTDAVKDVVLGTGQFENVSVSTRLVINFDEVKNTMHEYIAAEGQEQGLLSHEDYYEGASATNDDQTAGVPGTDSNTQNGPTYVTGDDKDSTKSNEKQWSKDYLPSESITETKNAIGAIVSDKSMVSLSAYKYHIYKQEDVQTQGLLEDITWEQFKVLNQEKVKMTVDEDLKKLVAFAAGVPIDNVAITAYEEPVFYDAAEPVKTTPANIIVIVLTVLIVLLLAFVIFRTLAGEKKKQEEPMEEELAVESMLQSEPELQDIDTDQKSEMMVLIEKFVDENPESVALLLRNWLDEEWGV